MAIEFIDNRNRFFEDVKALGRKNSATLGFMPEGGFGSPQEMWNKHSERLGIDKQGFYSYYNGYSKAVGIEFEMIKAVAPIGLVELRNVDPNFHTPQIYRYVTNKDIIEVLSRRIK